MPFERPIFTVVARVTLDRTEADLDHHLVLLRLADDDRRDALVPLHKGAKALRRKQMNAARNVAGICAKARVVGVAFFDYKHGQTGVAPNAIELHPHWSPAAPLKGSRDRGGAELLILEPKDGR